MQTKSNEVTLLPENSPVRLYPIGLVFDRIPTWEEYCQTFSLIRRTHGATLWWLGDLINLGEGTFGEKFAQLIDPMDYDSETIRKAAWVCNRIPFKLRHERIPFSTYNYIAKLEGKNLDDVIAKILKERMTGQEVRQYLKAKEHTAADSPPVLALNAVTKFSLLMKKLLNELPAKKWHPDSSALLRTAFESLVIEVRSLFGWEK